MFDVPNPPPPPGEFDHLGLGLACVVDNTGAVAVYHVGVGVHRTGGGAGHSAATTGSCEH